jgi:hypothetical protein
MAKLTLTKDISVIYGEPDIALVLAESKDGVFVLVAADESVAQLASYAKLGIRLRLNRLS